MIVEGALGDAYGAGFEFASREVIEAQNNLSRYIPHPRYDSIYRRYTDDTQMALALAELLLEDREWTPLKIANKFVEAFKRDPRLGYGSKVYKALSGAADGASFLQLINPDSIRNGASMRAYPIGLLPDLEEVMHKAALQASITHNTPEGKASAQAVALMQHYTRHQLGKLQDMPLFLRETQGIQWSSQWTGEVQINGMQTVEAVLTILCQHQGSMSALLRASVALGGDVDTVASLSLAIASHSSEVANDLPTWLYTDIENGTYGLDYLKKIDERLLQVVA